MDFAYSVFLDIFPVKSVDSESRYLKLLLSVIMDFLIFIQNIQFFWYKEMPIRNWSKYKQFWEVLCMPALDRFLSYLSFLEAFLFFILSIEVLSIVLLGSLAALKYFNRPTRSILCILTRLVIVLNSRLLFIPSLSVLLFTYRSSYLKGSETSDYQRVYLEDLDMGTYGQVFTVLMAFWLIALTFCYEVTHFEMRPKIVEKFEDSKISPMSDLVLKLIQVLNCFLLIFLKKEYYESFLLYAVVAYGASSFYTLYSYPFYSRYLNLTKFFFQFDLMFVSLFFWVGLKNDDSLTILMLFIAMQPGIAILSYSIVRYREKFLVRSKINPNKGFSRFERSIRKLLRSGSCEGLLEKLNKNYVRTKDKRNLIITAYYCYDIEKNPSLALNKIYSTDHRGMDIILNYHIFTCKFLMKKVCKDHSFTFKIYQYILSLMEIRSQDKDFCLVYYNFFKVILGKSPVLAQVKQSVRLVVEKIKILEKNYEKYVNEFPSSVEIKEMYESFLCCIKGEVQASSNYLGRSFRTSANHLDNFSWFIKNKIILMISGNSRSLGRIFFTNQEFLILLKYSKSALEDLNMSVLLPKQVSKEHEKKLLNFIESSTSSILCDEQLLFLIDFEGFVIESQVRADCIALDDRVNFIYSIEILNRDRELALVTQEGWISDHSRKFTSILGIPKPYINNSFFEEFFPSFQFKDLLKSSLIKLSVKNNDTGSKYPEVFLHLKQVKVFSVVFYVLYVLHPAEGLDLANEKEFFTISKKFDESLEYEREKVQIIDENYHNKDEDEEEKIEKDLKIPASSTSHSSIGLNYKEMNSFKKSILVLNVSKVILITLVISLITSNIVILLNMSQEVDHSLSLDAIVNLNYLSYSLAQVALILRSNDISLFLGRPQYFSDSDFDSIIKMIEKYQAKLFEDLDNWKYCKASKIVDHPTMAYWEISDSIDLHYDNLYTFVEFVKKNALKANKNMKIGADYKFEIINVLSNSLEGPFDEILSTIDGLVDCETSRITNLEQQRTSLLIIGIAVLAASISIIGVYLRCSDKHLNALWEHLRTRSLSQVYNIRQSLNERLLDYHNRIDSVYEEIEGLKLRTSKSFKFNHSYWFVFKMSALFLLATLFLFLAIFEFYSGLRDYLYFRPLLIVAFPRRRIQLSELAFVVLEAKAKESQYSLIDLYPEFSNLLPVKVSIKDKLAYIKTTGKYINNKDTKKLMSSELYNRIFRFYPNSSHFLDAGTYRAVALLNQESLFICFNNIYNSFELVDKFIDRIIEFDNAINFLSARCHTDSKSIIENQLNSMIIFIGCVGSILLLSYFIFYLPLLRREIKILKNIVKILKIIPRTPGQEVNKI